MIPVTEPDFETQVLAAGVNVFFKPTKSRYTFLRLSKDKHVARSAPLSRDATVRHAGATGEYDPAQVFEMAYQLASMVAKRRASEADVLQNIRSLMSAFSDMGWCTAHVRYWG